MFGKSANKVAINKLHKQSKQILDVFTQTITNLNSVNSEIEGHLSTREDELKRIQEEQEHLNSIMANNNKIISNIEKILV
jgi:hypothetical protein